MTIQATARQAGRRNGPSKWPYVPSSAAKLATVLILLGVIVTSAAAEASRMRAGVSTRLEPAFARTFETGASVR
jgi:hypothetical protein